MPAIEQPSKIPVEIPPSIRRVGNSFSCPQVALADRRRASKPAKKKPGPMPGLDPKVR
jgi:hypothetical protein